MKTKLLFLIINIITFFNIYQILYAQYNDPNKDQIPYDFLDNSNPQSVFVVVTDANGFDNFNIGTDFGEPHLVMNPTNPLNTFLAYNTNNAHYTIDGYNWSVTFSPGFSVATRGDPVTAFDSLGNLYYENMVGSPDITGTRIIKSLNGGISFNASVAGNTGVDKNWMAADQTNGPFKNNIYLVMTPASPNPGNVKRSSDGGVSFAVADTLVNSYPGMMVCVGPNGATSGGAVYIVTNTGANAFAVTYNFYLSTTGGTNFVLKSSQNFAGYVGTYYNSRHSVDTMRTRPYPMITADNSYGTYRGRLYLVYATNNPAGNGNKPDIYCRYSTDQGATFSTAVIVNDNANPTLTHQFFPAIWCDKTTGRLYCKWFDSRNDLTNDSIDVYASYSDNGGITWASNQRITTKMSKINCTTCGGGGNPRYQGDYDAINSNSKTSVMAWTDMRAGSFGSYTAYFPDFGMLVTPASNNVHQTNSSVNYLINIPAVKLYTDVTTFSAVVTPNPVTGNFAIEFPGGNTLSAYPDTKYIKVKTVGTVSPGTYTVTITGQGSNGTPVHKRTVSLSVNTTVGPVPCESFLDLKFPPANFFEEFSGTNYWARYNPTAYGIGGSGSAKFNSWTADSGTIQSIVTNNFPAAAANTYLTFDNAYAPWSGGNIDSLIIEASSDFGVNYNVLSQLWGGLGTEAGPLNTVFSGGGQFTPENDQWANKIFLLPVGTNKIKFRARSGSGNDIWIDNICVQTLDVPSSSASIICMPQGFYRPLPFFQTIQDTVRTYLCRTDFPNIKVDSAISYLSANAVASSPYTRVLSGNYYIVVSHRNCIETWSKSGGELYTRGSTLSFNFINPVNQSYNNNQALVDPFPYYGMFGGDVNRDNTVDLADLSQIENAAANYTIGYVIQDVTGDNFVDLSDQLIADNNSYNFVMRQAPPGAEPKPKPLLQSVPDNFNKNRSVK